MYDLIIIGAGTAGISAYKEAVKSTQNILIINEGSWDTTCARVGCMPSKVMISVANRMHDIQHAEEVALHFDGKIDTSSVMPHVRQLRDRFTAATLKDVNQWPDKHKISGKASFVDAQTVTVNGQQYQAKAFILAVGSTPTINTEWKKELGSRLITSDQVFELENLPKSLAVIGSGVIAIELAQAMHRLGVKTTVFARSKKVGTLSSPKLQNLAQQVLTKELNIKFEILPDRIKNTATGADLYFTENGLVQSISVDYVLSATGRRSNLDSLNLHNISKDFEDLKQLPVNAETKQLADLPIFITGDAFTKVPVQHEAAHDGRQAVINSLNFPDTKQKKKLTPLGIMFCSPEMASAGQSFQQLSRDKIDFVTGFVSFEKQGRAIVLGQNKGAVEVYFERDTHKLLGAELFCPAAEHMAHLICWMIQQKAILEDLLDQAFYHPTLEEGLRTAFKHARRQLI